jgi:hypothetical protein
MSHLESTNDNADQFTAPPRVGAEHEGFSSSARRRTSMTRSRGSLSDGTQPIWAGLKDLPGASAINSYPSCAHSGLKAMPATAPMMRL